METSQTDAPETERTLVARLKAGDEAGFEALVRRHGRRMLQVARRFLQHEAEAQDCVQDALLKAFRSIDTFEERAALGTWLHRIVVTSALMRLRARRRRPERALEDLQPEFDGNGCRPEQGSVRPLDAIVATRQQRALVRDAIARLPDDHRDVLLLRDIEGFDTQEAAALLGITPGATKTRLHRARAALKRLLEPLMWEADT